MKALLKKDLQQKLEVVEIDEPKVRPNTVKIRVKATGICGTDLHILKNEYKHFPPNVLGHEYAGEIVEVGEGVRDFSVGERVTSLTTAVTCERCDYCIAGLRLLCKERQNLGTHLQGAFAEYVVIDNKLVHKIPDNVSFDEAALTEPLACDVHGLMEMSRIMAGDVVLVSGPGSVGLLAQQIVKAEGGIAVVCGTTKDEKKLALARELGADAVVNVEKANLKDVIMTLTNGEGVDMGVECAGVEGSAKQCLDLIKSRGKYHQLGIFSKPIQFDLDKALFHEIVITSSFGHTHFGFKKGLELMGAGKIKTKPLITAKLPLEEWKKGFDMMENKEGIKILLYT